MRFIVAGLVVLFSANGFASQPRASRGLNLLGCIDCFNFVAPGVLGAENISPAEIGLIVYDSSYQTFRGFKQNGTWSKLSAEKTTAVANTTGNIGAIADVVFADSTSGAITLTLPSAAVGAGKEILVKKVSSDTNFVTIDGYSAETIDGQAQIALFGKNAVLELVSDGTNFLVKNSHDSWRVDASISGANPSLGTTSVSSYAMLQHASLSISQNSGSAPVQIGCDGTNSPTGSACSSGNESVSVAFNIPKAGPYRACVNANHYVDAPTASVNVAATFQIVETATNAQSIVQQGNGKAMSGSVAISGDRREYRSIATCGDFVFSSSGQKMLRLAYETEISGTPDNNFLKADGDATLGQPDIRWTVIPL